MIVKTKSSVVIKPYSDDVDKDDGNPDNNLPSSSRLTSDAGDDSKPAEAVKKSDEVSSDTEKIEEKKLEPKEQKDMDLSQVTNLDALIPNIDEVLGINKSQTRINSQIDEAQIQKITNNLEATGASILQQSNGNGSLNGHSLAPVPSIFPNTSFTHQLPATVLQPPSSHLTSSPAPIRTPVSDALRVPNLDIGLGSNPSTPASSTQSPGVWDVFNKEIANFADGDLDSPKKPIGLKVLSPLKLNEKAPETTPSSVSTNLITTPTLSTPRTIVLTNPTQQIHVRGINPTPTRIMVQNPMAANISVSGIRAVSSEYLNPLNAKLQSPGGMPPVPVIRISAPSQVVSQGVVISHPPSQGSPRLSTPTSLATSPAAAVSGPATPNMSASPVAAVGASPPSIRGIRPTTTTPRGGPRMRGGVVRPGMRPRLVRPGGPGAPGPRGMRPRGPMPPGARPRALRPGMRPGGPGTSPIRAGAPRPGGPRAVRPPQPAASAAATPATPDPKPAGPGYAPPPKPKPLKVECIDIDDSDDDSPPAPPAAKSATLEKLKACGISISKQKAPTLPSGVRLPPGISLGSSGSGSAPKRPSTSTYSNGEPSTKRVPVDSNVASAISNISGASSEPKKKVELELSEKQINALKALGML